MVQIGPEEVVIDLPSGACQVSDFLEVEVRATLENSEFEFHVVGKVTRIDADEVTSDHCHVRLSLIQPEVVHWKAFVATIEQRQARLANILLNLVNEK